ncbi:uncharacterized protein LOC107418723 isoform X2 [Ziziphus jujuba]|uniref:H(+)-transporting two-sector ATPase n=1 Tax=Ziziphus jujuba TaxID=326968 RepID=A0ABM3IJR6_ZIZJJ|nr:uncharacterized protein LOC107418723 isoform X2 [Ziziphus jujuba]
MRNQKVLAFLFYLPKRHRVSDQTSHFLPEAPHITTMVPASLRGTTNSSFSPHAPHRLFPLTCRPRRPHLHLLGRFSTTVAVETVVDDRFDEGLPPIPTALEVLDKSIRYLLVGRPLTLGRIMNVIGEPLSLILSETGHFLPIHREAQAFVEQATERQILVTGIKVVSLCLLVWENMPVRAIICTEK